MNNFDYNVETTYAPSTDTTFILKHTYKDDEPVSTEVVGFYFGRPNDELTLECLGKLKAEF